MKKTALAIVLVLLLPVLALAQKSSTATAIESAQEFYDSVTKILSGMDESVSAPATKALLERKVAAVRELETLDITETPSSERHEKAARIMDEFMASSIETLRFFKAKAPPQDREKAEAAMNEALFLRKTLNEEIRDLHRFETFREKEREEKPPVPIIDRSPQETPPQEQPGIWYR